MIGLADCNNFFVSCERSVNPSLEGIPVVVMSNNDGCVVARSNEAKQLGIKMGQPVFEIRQLINSKKVVALSGNHLLYRDISLRVHDIFRRYIPATIDYSVDEAFLDMDGIPASELPVIGEAIFQACWKEAHIPVTIGFSYSKTLSKIITEVCKKRKTHVGVLTDENEIRPILASLPVSELWGIGRRLAKRLYESGVYTIEDFRQCNRQWVRSKMGVTGERSWLELNGIDCISLESIGRIMQDSISQTRTFPFDVSDYDYIRSRIMIYAASCAKKLRAMKCMCNQVSVFLRTNRFHTEKGIDNPFTTIRLQRPSHDTNVISSAAVIGLYSIFNKGFSYKRAGVILSEISPYKVYAPSLFDDDYNYITSKDRVTDKFMHTIDQINFDIKHPLIKLAAQLTTGHPWHNDGYSSSFQAPSDLK